MKLEQDNIQTKEVLEWQGVHLLNFSQSSCSQKVRILLAEKEVSFTSHEIDLKRGGHTTPWFLGINSRGVVPVLIHDGQVHIESNDILKYIDETFSSSKHSWIPSDSSQQETVNELLELEDKLHADLRVITMGYLLPQKIAKKSDKEMAAYASNGKNDPYRDKQIAWWRAFNEHGITDQQAKDAVSAFYQAFQSLDALLRTQPYLLGDQPTVLDIAWFISIFRLHLAGYPLDRHPNVETLFKRLLKRPAFQQEISKGPLMIKIAGPVYRSIRRIKGTTLKSIFPSVEASLAH